MAIDVGGVSAASYFVRPTRPMEVMRSVFPPFASWLTKVGKPGYCNLAFPRRLTCYALLPLLSLFPTPPATGLSRGFRSALLPTFRVISLGADTVHDIIVEHVIERTEFDPIDVDILHSLSDLP